MPRRHGTRGVPGIFRNDEDGFLLVWAIIIMSLGSILITALLAYTSTSLRSAESVETSIEEYYTADAAVSAVLADLALGEDALDQAYAEPYVTLNGVTASVTVSAAPGTGPDPVYRYFDILTSGGVAIPSGQSYTYQVDDVVAGSDVQVNWSFSPAAKTWTVTLYEGSGVAGAVIATNSGDVEPGYLAVPGSGIAGGTYTIELANTGDAALTANSFSSAGTPASTWLYTRARQDYLVSVTAGNARIVVVARQQPGPTAATLAAPELTILSWQASP